MSETVKKFFFLPVKKWLWQTSSAITDMTWYLLHSMFSKWKSLSIAADNLYDNFSIWS